MATEFENPEDEDVMDMTVRAQSDFAKEYPTWAAEIERTLSLYSWDTANDRMRAQEAMRLIITIGV